MLDREKTKVVALLAGLALMLGSCEKIEEEPAWFYLAQPKVVTDYAKEGTASSNIFDIWVSAGNEFIGTYEMPVEVPVLSSGPKKLTLLAGIKANGISTTRVPYPLYEPLVLDRELVPGGRDTIDLEFKYKSFVKFALIENFDGTFKAMETTSANKATISYPIDSAQAFEGRSALKAVLNDQQRMMSITTKDNFTIKKGANVWMEINYKNEVPLEIGILSVQPTQADQIPVLGLVEKANWNKVYVNLGTTLGEVDVSTTFKIYILSVLPEGKDKGEVYIDNIKIGYIE